MKTVMKTVFITGASTGIGRAAALVFQKNGWNVVATMRSPAKETELTQLDRLYCVALDVTDPGSIQAAFEQAVQKFGAIDVLINNAGYALTGAFEGCTPEQIERQFATNVFGLMSVTRTFLPHFRSRQQGTIINVASVGGRIAFPLYSLYHSTKWAIEGFSESLQYELEPLNIRVKLIEPGAIKTDFYKRSIETAVPLPDYAAFSDRAMPRLNHFAQTGSPPEVTAAVIYRAAIDRSGRLRYPAGGNAGALLFLRKLLPDRLFRAFIRWQIVR
jgi:NAD(P)-dependent dehydrogenase (short-subunit alcohol dehydrogenase family)